MPPPVRRDLSNQAIIAELYRGILHREPDPGGLEYYCRQLANGDKLATVAHALVQSEEFRAHNNPVPINRFLQVDQDPPLSIQLDLSATQLTNLWARVAATWTRLGDEDPYWSVISAPQFHLSQMTEADALAAFYDTGRGELRKLEAWLGRHGLGLHQSMTCAEYGCGVGRLTTWLAERCGQLRAFDISPTHIAKARSWVERQGRDNVDFIQVRTPADLAQLAGTDLFFSVIVLQHNPPPIMRLVLSESFALLNPGGIAFFQLPTYRAGYSFALDRYLADLGGDGDIEMHVLQQQDVFAIAAEHQLALLEVQQDGLINDWGTSHSFLFRKTA